jgi:RNA polymerase sigma factor (sigma-70 family)
MEPSVSHESRPSLDGPLFRVWMEQRKRLERRCRRLLRWSKADAEDAFARVTVVMVQYARNGATIRNPAAWLNELVRNACIDVQREAARRYESMVPIEELEYESAALEHLNGHFDPERTYLERESAKALLRAIEALPPHYRRALLMRVDAEMSYAEMAGILQESEENLRKRVQLARRLLARCLGK